MPVRDKAGVTEAPCGCAILWEWNELEGFTAFDLRLCGEAHRPNPKPAEAEGRSVKGQP